MIKAWASACVLIFFLAIRQPKSKPITRHITWIHYAIKPFRFDGVIVKGEFQMMEFEFFIGTVFETVVFAANFAAGFIGELAKLEGWR